MTTAGYDILRYHQRTSLVLCCHLTALFDGYIGSLNAMIVGYSDHLTVQVVEYSSRLFWSHYSCSWVLCHRFSGHCMVASLGILFSGLSILNCPFGML
jgi:hypothetical protein